MILSGYVLLLSVYFLNLLKYCFSRIKFKALIVQGGYFVLS